MNSRIDLALDDALHRLASRVAKLSRRQTAAFFGCVGVALLPLYQRFSERNNWGDASVLGSALDVALGYAMGNEVLTKNSQAISNLIASVIPDEQDFDIPESTFAMDAAICVDAAVRASCSGLDLDPVSIEYALDPAITTVCEQETGYLSLGSAKEKAWRSHALKNPVLRAAFDALAEMAGLLSQVEGAIRLDNLESLQRLGAKLLPPTLQSIKS